MATVLAGDNVLMTINGALCGQTVMSTFCYVIESVTGSIDDTDLFGAFRTSICAAGELVDKYLACCPSNYVKGNLWFQIVRPQRIQKRVFGNSAPGGLSPYVADMPNVATTILRRGDIADRKNISTLHVPAPTTNDWIDTGSLTIEALTANQALATKVLKSYTTATFVANFYPSILNKGTSSDVTPIISASAETTSRVMRRRTVGVGK